MAKPSFHAFTFEGKVFSGLVIEAVVARPPTVTFKYEYEWKSVTVSGTFHGQADGEGIVRGTWSETSATAINGKTSWSGSATLKACEQGDRAVFHGTWERPKDERWIVDIAKER